MIIDDFRKRLRLIRRIIFILFIAGISVFYTFAKDIQKEKEALTEHKKTANILKNVVALVDYRIKEGKDDYNKELNKLFNVDGLTFVDAFAEGDNVECSCRKIDKIVMRYKALDGKNRYVRIKSFYEYYILSYFDRIYYQGEPGDSILGYGNISDIEVFSDEDDAGYSSKFERRVKGFNDSNSIYKKESDCCYLVRFSSGDSLCEVDEDGNKITKYYITADDLKDVKEDNAFLNYEKSRYNELKDYISKKASQTEKYEKSISTRIKRLLTHNENMNNERVRKFIIVDDKNEIITSYKNMCVIEAGHDENSKYSIFGFLYLQMILFGIAWGLLGKFIPKLLGYKEMGFLEGMIFGGIPFFVATFIENDIHTWLSWAFLLGSLPMIEGILVALKIKSENRYIKKKNE